MVLQLYILRVVISFRLCENCVAALMFKQLNFPERGTGDERKKKMLLNGDAMGARLNTHHITHLFAIQIDVH